MNKINIKDLYLIFGNEKQKALRLLKEGKSKSEILKAAGCTIAVRDANLSIDEGEIFVIMGLSGSGKSTLLRCINRLIKPTPSSSSRTTPSCRNSPAGTSSCATDTSPKTGSILRSPRRPKSSKPFRKKTTKDDSFP